MRGYKAKRDSLCGRLKGAQKGRKSPPFGRGAEDEPPSKFIRDDGLTCERQRDPSRCSG